jgi:hypothetical protein
MTSSKTSPGLGIVKLAREGERECVKGEEGKLLRDI